MNKKLITLASILGLLLVLAVLPSTKAATPANDTTDSYVTNPSGGGFNQYWMYNGQTYTIQQNASDADGYDNLSICQVSLYDNARATEYWRIQFNQTSGLFSEQLDTYSAIALTGSNVSTGNYVIISYSVTILRHHQELPDIDLKYFCNDSLGGSDTDWVENAQGTYEITIMSQGGLGDPPVEPPPPPPALPLPPLFLLAAVTIGTLLAAAYARRRS